MEQNEWNVNLILTYKEFKRVRSGKYKNKSDYEIVEMYVKNTTIETLNDSIVTVREYYEEQHLRVANNGFLLSLASIIIAFFLLFLQDYLDRNVFRTTPALLYFLAAIAVIYILYLLLITILFVPKEIKYYVLLEEVIRRYLSEKSKRESQLYSKGVRKFIVTVKKNS